MCFPEAICVCVCLCARDGWFMPVMGVLFLCMNMVVWVCA